METLINDVRHGCRLFFRNPGFTLIVILALAVGIGANTAVFSVINAVLLKPLPYRDADHIVSIAGRFTGIGIPDDRNLLSPPELVDIRRYSMTFSDVAGTTSANYNIRTGETPERVSGALVSAGFFRVLGVDAQIGRTFSSDEDQQGKDRVAVLGYGLWRRMFGSDSSVVGHSVEVSGQQYSIIGVMPAGFQFPDQSEMWTPLTFTDAQLGPNFRGSHGLQAYARIKPKLTLAQALTDMDRTTQQIVENNQYYPYSKANFAVLIRPLIEDYVGDIRPALVLLMAAVGLVLLIACSNVANLLMVRATAREREIGIRVALGANRKRLVRQLLTESILLSAAGGLLGIGLARAGVSAIASIGRTAFPRLAQSSVDVATLIFTLIVTVITGLIFGIVPALHVSQSSTSDSLKDGGRSSTAGSGQQRLRRILVAAEVALSLALLSGAGLLVKSFMRLQEIDPGFKPDSVLTVRVALPGNRYIQPEQIRTFFRDLIDRIAHLPGVQSAGAINGLPLSGNGGSGTTTVDTTAVPADKAAPEADWRVVTPGFMETMGMQLVSGRFFNDHDTDTSEPVAVIDETMARTYWPNEDAVGKRIRRGGTQSTQPWLKIVGVVKHVRYLSLEQPSRVQLYWPLSQTPTTTMSMAIKTAVDPSSLAIAVRRTAMTIDPEQPVFAIRPMNDLLADSMARRRLVMVLLGVFAGVALTLAALGIYGVISYWVTQRLHEIGIRLALGATRPTILKMVVRESTSVVAIGVVFGLLGSVSLTQSISAMLFQVNASDPATFGVVCALLLVIGIIAGMLPALRASMVNPIHTLRKE
jgi:putative ABC transport system permease protein